MCGEASPYTWFTFLRETSREWLQRGRTPQQIPLKSTSGSETQHFHDSQTQQMMGKKKAKEKVLLSAVGNCGSLHTSKTSLPNTTELAA